MNGTFEPTRERRTGSERRRNMAAAINPAVAVMQSATAVQEVRRISWGAIFAGVVLALITQLALTLVGLTLGFSTGDASLGRGTAIWMVVTTIVALFAGGLVAGRLTGLERRYGAVHGVLSWGLMALIAFYLTTTAVGRALSFSAVDLTGGLTRVSGTSTTDVSTTSGPTTAYDLVTLIERMQPTEQSGDSAALERLRARGMAVLNTFDRDDAITAVVDRTGVTRDEAKATVDGWMAKQRGATGMQRPAPVTEDTGFSAVRAHHAAGAASFWTFIGLCVGALAAALGGYIGGRGPRYVHRTLVS